MARNFPHWIRAYVEHAQHSESPLIYHVWTAVSTIAAALRRKVWIDQLEYQYYANFYIVLVGPAGITKTSAINRGKSLLRALGPSERSGVYFGPQSATWQSMIKSMGDSAQDVVLPGQTSGITTCPVTISAGELGTFFKVEDSIMMDVLTALWDCPDGPWTHSTLTTGNNTVENPWINLIGGTTPTWIKKHFPEDLIGGGLTSRIVFVYSDRKHQLVAYPARETPPENYHAFKSRLVEDLNEISNLKGIYRLTEEAYEWGTEWYTYHNTHRPENLASERYSSYLARKQVYVHKLAIILAAAKRNELVITVDDLKEALSMVELVEPSMLHVFESIGQVDEARRMKELVHFVKSYNVLTARELWALVTNIMTYKDFKTTLVSAIENGALVTCTKGGQRAVTIPKEK